MKRNPLVYLVPIAAIFVVLAVLLFFFNPWAPLFMLASILIQLPIVWVIARSAFAEGYARRAETRKRQFNKDGNAEAWLQGESAEAQSVGFRYWPRGTQVQNTLQRIELMLQLGRREEAIPLLTSLSSSNLSTAQRQMLYMLREEAGVMPKTSDDHPAE